MFDQIGAELTDCLLSCAGVIPMSGERILHAGVIQLALLNRDPSSGIEFGVMPATPVMVCYFNSTSMLSNNTSTKLEDSNADRTIQDVNVRLKHY